MASIAYCISPASYAKTKKLGILEEEYPSPVSNQMHTVISHLPQALKDTGKRIIQALQANSDFSWNDDFNIIWNGKIEHNSDIAALIKGLVEQDSILYTLPGSDLFISSVKQHVSSELFQLPSATEIVEFNENHWIRFEDKFNFV
jgi:hypothetical protein